MIEMHRTVSKADAAASETRFTVEKPRYLYRLVGGNPDFTNAPGHGDDDARFYDRQQAYVHARGG